ncbi:MAG: ATP-binding protein [Hyphomicrobium sp.]
MRLINLSRGIGIRIAALSALLIVVSMVALGTAVYTFIDDALRSRGRLRIEEEVSRMVALNAGGRLDVIAAEIERQTLSGVTTRFAYHIVRMDGTHVVGDLWLDGVTPGWHRQTITKDHGTGEHLLILTTALNHDLLLSIGRDVHWISDVDEELFEILLRALLGGIVLALVTALIANRLVARRVDLITDSANEIMKGHLKHRVPITGANDDFDRLSQTLNVMLDRNQALMESLEQVSNDIAHDLRTPLGRLRQGLEQVQRDDGASPAEYADAVDRAIVEADGLLATFTALLRIAQIEAGARKSAFRRFDLSEALHSVSEAYELSAEDEGHRLTSQIEPGIMITGDRDLIVQMAANLIENALAHTPAGTDICVSLERRAGSIVAAVADHGLGVPESEWQNIFRRFYRREVSRTTPGTGLGLSLVAAVARLHGARAEASDNHPGLRMDIVFPNTVTP